MAFTPSTNFSFRRPWIGLSRFQWPESGGYAVRFDGAFPAWTGEAQISAGPTALSFGSTFPSWFGSVEIRSLRAELSFGSTFPAWSGSIEITLPKTIQFDGVFAAWAGEIRLKMPVKMRFDAGWVLYLAGFVDFETNINVGRPSTSRVCSTVDARPLAVSTAGAGQPLARRSVAPAILLGDAVPLTAGITGTVQNMARRSVPVFYMLRNAIPVAAGIAGVTRDMRRLAAATQSELRNAQLLGFGIAGATRDMRRLALPIAGMALDGRQISIGRTGAVALARRCSLVWPVQAQDARRISTSNWRAPASVVEPPEPPVWENQNPWEFRPFLVIPNIPFFRWPDVRGQRIPIREVYIVTSTATLVRLPGGEEIDTTSFSLQADMESSYWRLSAGLVGRAAYTLLQPVDEEPVEVALIVSGCPQWNFIVDRVTGNRTFLSDTFTLSARSASALLGAGWARVRTYTESEWLNRRQLADQELADTGWTLDPWNIPDWLLPSGSSPSWSYQGLTPIEAIRALVEMDGYMLPHPNEPKIGVYPRYSVLPWHWYDLGTVPDLIVPASIVTSVSLEPRFSRDAGLGWNAVFVRGSGPNGGFWKVKRTESAGDMVPDDMLVSPIMTHVDGARAWGSRWLADAEPLMRESIELPLDSGAGIPLISLGALLEYSTQEDTWRGIVRDFVLSGRVQGEGLVMLQTATVERHYEPV